MPSSKARPKKQKCILLYVLVIVLSFAVYCGQNNEKAAGEGSETTSNAIGQPLVSIKSCALCGKEITAETAGRLTLDVGKELSMCCAYCMSRIKMRIGKQPFDAVTVCFSTGQKIDFKKAFFVVESDEAPCCRPSVLAFVSLEEAQKFAQSRNGRIISYKAIFDYAAKIKKDPN
jgi:hypothetical protein